MNPLGDFRGENETREYFLNEYLPLHLSSCQDSLAERRAHLAAIRRQFSLPKRPRLLDVGCALGFMLQEAKAAGWEAVGVESSEFAAKYATEHTGCPVYAGTLEKAAFPSESFDVISLMDVIEHIPNPSDLIREIYRILSPDGIIFVVTPNFGSLFVQLYGRTAYGVWPDQHVVYYQPSTLTRLLRDNGFSRVITGSKDFYAQNLSRFFPRKGTNAAPRMKAAFGRTSPLRRVRQAVNRILMYVPVGDKLIAFAQKNTRLGA